MTQSLKRLPTIQYPKYRRVWVNDTMTDFIKSECGLVEVSKSKAITLNNYLVFYYCRYNAQSKPKPLASDYDVRYVVASGMNPTTVRQRPLWPFSDDFSKLKSCTPNEITQLNESLSQCIFHIGEYMQGQLLGSEWKCYHITHITNHIQYKENYTTLKFSKIPEYLGEYSLPDTAMYRGYHAKLDGTHDDVVID